MVKSKKTTKEDSKPHLASAFFCEKIIEDKDQVFSCIRIVDTLTITLGESAPPEAPSEQRPIPVLTHALISFKKGRSRRRFYNLQIDMESMSGKTKEIYKQRIEFPKETPGGFSLVLNSTMLISKGGLLWMCVKLDGELKTKMPLRIIVKRNPEDSESQ